MSEDGEIERGSLEIVVQYSRSFAGHLRPIMMQSSGRKRAMNEVGYRKVKGYYAGVARQAKSTVMRAEMNIGQRLDPSS